MWIAEIRRPAPASAEKSVNLFLQSDVQLHAEGGRLFLAREGVPVEHLLGVGEALALALLAATGNAEAAQSAAAECLRDGAHWVPRVIDRYWTYLGDGEPRPLDLAWLERATRMRMRLPLMPQSQLRREAAPTSVTWLVTLGCNRRCPYCFFDVFDHAVDREESPADAT